MFLGRINGAPLSWACGKLASMILIVAISWTDPENVLFLGNNSLRRHRVLVYVVYIAKYLDVGPGWGGLDGL